MGVSLHRSNGRERGTNEENIKDMEVCAIVSHLSVRNRQTRQLSKTRCIFIEVIIFICTTFRDFCATERLSFCAPVRTQRHPKAGRQPFMWCVRHEGKFNQSHSIVVG